VGLKINNLSIGTPSAASAGGNNSRFTSTHAIQPNFPADRASNTGKIKLGTSVPLSTSCTAPLAKHPPGKSESIASSPVPIFRRSSPSAPPFNSAPAPASVCNKPLDDVITRTLFNSEREFVLC